MTCPKCGKSIVPQGHPNDDERDMEKRDLNAEPSERVDPHTMNAGQYY